MPILRNPVLHGMALGEKGMGDVIARKEATRAQAAGMWERLRIKYAELAQENPAWTKEKSAEGMRNSITALEPVIGMRVAGNKKMMPQNPAEDTPYWTTEAESSYGQAAREHARNLKMVGNRAQGRYGMFSMPPSPEQNRRFATRIATPEIRSGLYSDDAPEAMKGRAFIDDVRPLVPREFAGKYIPSQMTAGFQPFDNVGRRILQQGRRLLQQDGGY